MPLDRSIFSGYNDPKFTDTIPESSSFQTLKGKSEKINKKTGKSPFQTALEAALSSAQDTVAKQDLARKNTANENMQKLIGDAFNNQAKIYGNSQTTAAQAQAQQDKEAAALVEGLKAAWAKGTLPANRQAPAIPGGAPPTVGKADASAPIPDTSGPPPTDDSGTPIPTPVYPKGTFDPGIQSPTGVGMFGAPTTTAKVGALESTVAGQKQEIADIKAAGGAGSDDSLLGAATSLLGGAIHIPLKAIATVVPTVNNWTAAPLLSSLDELWRTGSTEFQAMRDQGTLNPKITGEEGKPQPYIPDPKAPPGQDRMIPNPNYAAEMRTWRPVATNLWSALEQGSKEAISGHGVTGQQTLTDINPTVGHLPVVGPVGGFGLELGTDPTNYVDFGLGTLLKRFGIEVAPRAAIDIENELARGAIKAGTVKTASQGAVSAAASQAKKITKPLIQNGAAIGASTKHEQAAVDAFKGAIQAGASPGQAIAHARVVAENSLLAEAAHQKYLTGLEQSVKDNRRYISVKVAGHETGLGKTWPIDEPYQAVRGLKQAALNTKLGDAANKAFNINYWFPGITHILHNKAEAMGVNAFHNNLNDVREAFKGLSSADRKRIATETELGHSLAGAAGTKGIDLGPAQKFFKDSMDKMFDESSSVLGKYSPDQRVEDYVFHYYKKGDSNKIDAFRQARNSRLRAGATGTDRLTLEDAKKAGLSPIENADQILLAKMADHQRQMINGSFQRKMVDTYGHVTDNQFLVHELGLQKVTAPKTMKMAEGHALYMSPEAKRVYESTYDIGSRGEREANKLMRHYDQIMKYWKIGNTSLRPGHHIRNAIGDIYMNYVDGVINPYRYKQGLQMVDGNRSKLMVKVGNQTLNGDQIHDLAVKSGLAHGYIASEFGEGRNPLMHGINELSDKREMFARYAHFIDSLKKEGTGLSANNTAGLYKAGTAAAARVNKWNINYGDLTPFERTFMKRALPFYTFTRKAIPLILEAAATRPKTIAMPSHINHLISGLAGVDPMDMSTNRAPLWLQQAGYARISNEQEPNLESLPLPSQEPAKWFGSGNIDDFLKQVAQNTNPLVSKIFERAYGKNLATGAALPQSAGTYGMDQLAVASNIKSVANMASGNKADIISGINALTGLGVYRDTENRQLGELRRIQDPLQVQLSNLNKNLGDYEVHKLKYGYSVYNKKYKITEKEGLSSPAQAYIYALSLKNQGK